MTMRATTARRGLFSCSMVVRVSLVVVDAVWAEGEVSFIATRDFEVGLGPSSISFQARHTHACERSLSNLAAAVTRLTQFNLL
jgi:hypothetical protein